MSDQTIDSAVAGEKRPLVTFALFAYNQEKYIREAVEGALAQTYSPLEIILSDDCSADRTFEIMREMAAAYRGPHEVRLMRTKNNYGLANHVNAVMEKVSGDLVVAAAGDDISLPNRSARIVTEWLTDPNQIKLLHSNAQIITLDSQPVNSFRTGTVTPSCDIKLILEGKRYVLGATEAWHRHLFDRFGPLMSNLGNEDNALTVRAALIGSIAYIAEPLVFYRSESGVTHQLATDDAYLKFGRRDFTYWKSQQILFLQMKRDINMAGAAENKKYLNAWRAKIAWLMELSCGRKMKRTTFARVLRYVSATWMARQYFTYRAPRVSVALSTIRWVVRRAF